MGGAKRYPSTSVGVAMGIASLHPSYDERDFAISRRVSPEVCMFVCPPKMEGAGKTGCTLHPRSRVQLRKQKRTRAYRFSGNTPAFPAQGRAWAQKTSINQRDEGGVSTVVSLRELTKRKSPIKFYQRTSPSLAWSDRHIRLLKASVPVVSLVRIVGPAPPDHPARR